MSVSEDQLTCPRCTTPKSTKMYPSEYGHCALCAGKKVIPSSLFAAYVLRFGDAFPDMAVVQRFRFELGY